MTDISVKGLGHKHVASVECWKKETLLKYTVHLTLSMLGKISADVLEYILLFFSRKIGFDISCEFIGDTLHELSKPIFWKKEKNKNVSNLSFAEFTHGMVKHDMNH